MKDFIIVIIAIFLSIPAISQPFNYTMFPEDRKWIQIRDGILMGDFWIETYSVEKDTVIQAKTYKKSLLSDKKLKRDFLLRFPASL